MYRLSSKSKRRLKDVHPDLIRVIYGVLRIMDVTVIGGVRTEKEQYKLVKGGFSKTMKSKHLIQEDGYAHAVDIAPYPLDWDDKERFIYMQGIAKGVAEIMFNEGIISNKLRSGIDWDGDGVLKDHSFFDGPHLELEEK